MHVLFLRCLKSISYVMIREMNIFPGIVGNSKALVKTGLSITIEIKKNLRIVIVWCVTLESYKHIFSEISYHTEKTSAF